MPIRINLLAEAQAAEEMRRKDPVKRAILVSAALVCLMLLWCSSLQMKIMLARNDLTQVQAQLSTRSNEFKSVLEQKQKLQEVELKLRSLDQLARVRMLNGNLLDALQKSLVQDVQLVKVRAEQNYQFVEAVKPKTNSNSQVTPGKPATVSEKILVTLDAKDFGSAPGDQVNKYRGTLAAYPYFKELVATNEVRLANLSPPQVAPNSKPFVLFTLECRYPQVTR